MRTDNELLELIINVAVDDERIRAVTLNGSRASQTAVKDKYCDFDIVYFVKDVREFTRDKNWVSIYGDMLIVQYSMDWFSKPYDYTSRDTFIYLMQFADGHRIDLSIVDISNIEKEKEDREPRIVLLNKDNFKELETSMDESVYNITKPSEMEFYNTCNEFRWLSIYVTKGLCRRELYYSKYAYDVLIMEMFMKMLNWKIAVENDFSISTGVHSKYLKRYLSDCEMDRVHSIFPNGAYEDIWDKLFDMYDFFHELEQKVSESLGFSINCDERTKVKAFMKGRKND